MIEVEFRQFIENSLWRFAKTMPKNPHWYTLRENAVDSDFVDAVQFIRDNGEVVYFWSKPYTQYKCGGFAYWTMGNSIPETKLINRAKLNET